MSLFCRYICIVIAICLSYQLMGQDLTYFSQYLSSQAINNPAYVGSKNGVNLEAIVRGQWLDIEGAPMTQAIAVHTPVPLFNSGIGLKISNDIAGVGRHTEVSFAYAYQIYNKKQSLLSVGIEAGAAQRYLDGSLLITPQGNYEDGLDHQDNLIDQQITTSLLPKLNIGGYFSNNQLEIGVSIHNLVEFSDKNGIGGQTVEPQKRVMTLYSSYIFYVGSSYEVQPFGAIITDLNNYQTNLGVLATYNEFIQAGISFRGYNKNSVDALIGLLAYKPNPKIKIGYAYDFTLSTIKQSTRQTHEISINYLLIDTFSSKSSNILYNPRFL